MSADNMPKPKGKPAPGPEPERLKIEGDWKDAVRKVIPMQKPPEGWPSEGDAEGAGDDSEE